MAHKLTGTARLSQDMATLVNNRQGSDILFKVGGGIPQANDETIHDGSTIVTIYAHSLILRCRSRYFAAMLDEDKQWKESSNSVIYKPNVSPSTFEDVLYYIYTGTIRIKNLEKIVELIAAADEMDLEELKVECQTRLKNTVKSFLTKKNTVENLPADVAVSSLIVPALNLANSPSFSDLSQELLMVMLPNMSVIIESQDAYAAFVNGISSEALIKIIASDDLVMTERSIWDLVLSWACHQMNLLKTAVEARLTNYEDEEDEDEKEDDTSDLEEHTGERLSHPFVLTAQLKQLKTILTPFLPLIRFSLLDPKDYARMVDILSYFLSRRRSSELQRFFITSTSLPLDTPRKKAEKGRVKVILGSSDEDDFF